MILRRISDAIRKQDWFVVLVEVLVVVFGVFIGLQVDDWNQARHDRAEERLYLERLYEDLEVTLGEIESSVEQLNERYAQAQVPLLVFKGGALGTYSKEEFDTGIIVATRSELLIPQLSTITELISTGKLGLIKNENLRASIIRFDTRAKDRSGFIDLITSRTEQMIPLLFARYRRYKNPNGPGLLVDYNFETLLADKEFQMIFGNAVHILYTNSRWLDDFKGVLEDLKVQVGRELGKGEGE